MQEYIKNLKCKYSEEIAALFKKRVSFAMSGITNCSKLFILADFLLKNNKKLVYVVETEQTALKYFNDLKKMFNIDALVFPYQDGSIYDTNSKNLYKYAKQINILNNEKPNNVIIVPQKALFEKFSDKNFFQINTLNIKVDDDINIEEIALKLVKMGYKRKTLVADIGEFSIRGDIIDIYPLSENPYRLELWGDTVTDIRIFDVSNQRSISKQKDINIQPIYKFILNNE